METDQLLKKEEEIRSILNLYVFKLQLAGKIMQDATNNKQECDIEMYRELKKISIDLLSFLDFIDELSVSTSQTRCMIQDWLEIFHRKGIK